MSENGRRVIDPAAHQPSKAELEDDVRTDAEFVTLDTICGKEDWQTDDYSADLPRTMQGWA